MATVEIWREICRRAVEDAKAGDSKAREWLSKYVLGEAPRTLLELAKLEAAGFDTAREVQVALRQANAPHMGDLAIMAALQSPGEVTDADKLVRLLERLRARA